MDFAKEYQAKLDLINRALADNLSCLPRNIIREAMEYSLLSGGKRLRPVILLASTELAGGQAQDALPFACALEMIHTYSLIHDDLPAMDNDDLRRGLPTCHIKYGEAVAILAGDGLLNRAYETMAAACTEIVSPNFIIAMSEIAKNAGVEGMIGGQVVDIISENKIVDMDTLLYIHRHKTSKLFMAAFSAGVRIGGGDDAMAGRVTEIGEKFGLAFQIRDDLLDVLSGTEDIGKPANSDKRNNKSTYVSILSIEKSREALKGLAREIIDMLQKESKPQFLIELVEMSLAHPLETE